MRHLHKSGEPGRSLCGQPGITVHETKARRADCRACRLKLRMYVLRRRASSLRQTAQRTEFDRVARNLLDEAARLEARAAVKAVELMQQLTHASGWRILGRG